MNSILRAAVSKVVGPLEAEMERVRKFASHDDAQVVGLALLELMGACHDAIDALEAAARSTPEALADAATAARMDRLMLELAGSLPPVRGGGPDDHEEVSAEFLADPDGWPAEFDADVDGFRWVPNFDGPTPDDVLAASAPTWEPCDADWDDLYAANAPGLSEADHLAVHGCC